MNPEFDIYEKIDLYLNSRMESGERRAFESEMQSNIDLKETVEAQRIANMIVLDQGMIDLKAQMQRDMSGSSSSGSGFSAITVAIIGAVVVGAGVGAFLFTSNPSSEKSSSEKNSSEIVSGSSVTSVTPENPDTPSSSASGTNTKRDPATSNEAVTAELVPTPEEVVPPVTTPAPQHVATNENHPVNNLSPSHNICDDYSIEATFDIFDPCPNTDMGSIEITSVKKGRAPYQYSFQNQAFSKQEIFERLDIGKYTITIIDANGCRKTFPVTVHQSIDCIADPVPQQLNGGNHTFEPEVDREWNVPLSIEKNATLKIISRSGATVFQTKINYSSGFTWNGLSSAGTNVEAGYYLYTLEYEDGSIEKGSITILR